MPSKLGNACHRELSGASTRLPRIALPAPAGSVPAGGRS